MLLKMQFEPQNADQKALALQLEPGHNGNVAEYCQRCDSMA